MKKTVDGLVFEEPVTTIAVLFRGATIGSLRNREGLWSLTIDNDRFLSIPAGETWGNLRSAMAAVRDSVRRNLDAIRDDAVADLLPSPVDEDGSPRPGIAGDEEEQS